MTKFTFFIILVFLVILSMLAAFNDGLVILKVWKDIGYEMPVIALVIISTAVGILSMFVIVAIRDARRYIDSWQIQRQQKKDSKIQEQYSKGLNAFFAFRYEEAEELFERVIEDDPSHLDALLRLGDIYYSRQDFVKAIDSYMKAKELKPRNIEVLLSIEKVSVAQKNWKEALKYLNSVLDIDDENTKILFMKRDIYERNGKWEELIDVQQKILKRKLPEEEEAEENKALLGYKYELGKHYHATGDSDKAVKTLKSVLKSDKDFSAAYIALADVHLKDGNTKEAESILMKGYEETFSRVILARLEDHYITEGVPGTIIDLYQKAVQRDPNDLRQQFFMAKLYYRLEMIDHAFETINNIDTSSFDFPNLHALFGSIYERRAQYEKSIGEFKKALKVKRPLLIPFCCSVCKCKTGDWSGRCPECKNWNTMILDINEACETQKRQSSS